MKWGCCLSSKIRQILKWWVLMNAFWIRLRIVKYRFVKYRFETSSRHAFKTSSRHAFKTSWRRLKRNNFLSSRTSWRRIEDIFKTLCNCYPEDVLKTSLRPTNVCWDLLCSGISFSWPYLKNNWVILFFIVYSAKDLLWLLIDLI